MFCLDNGKTRKDGVARTYHGYDGYAPIGAYLGEEGWCVGLELRQRTLAMPDMAAATFSMQDQKPEVRVRFDRPKMAELGISAGAVSNAISTFFLALVLTPALKPPGPLTRSTRPS